MNHTIRLAPHACFGLLLLIASGTGCTSVLTSASLRDLVWDGDEHAAEAAATASDGEAAEPDTTPAGGDAADASAEATAEADAQRREAAIDEAVTRLAKLGHLDDAARTTLMETLDRTQQEDWPAVIDAFAQTLADTQPPAVADARPERSEPVADTSPAPASKKEADAHLVAKADLDATTAADPARAPEPAEPTRPGPTETAPTAMPAKPEEPTGDSAGDTVGPEPPSAAVVDGASEPSPADGAAAPAPPLAMQNACFATRVQAWGVVERFAADRFRPGQEVIVYFELDGLSAGESPAGHTTCIDATLRLVAADGKLLHDWSFEPIAETCRARRHDYFARYVVRLPETAPAGSCRIECDVTDTLSGQVATMSLPLEILAADR